MFFRKKPGKQEELLKEQKSVIIPTISADIVISFFPGKYFKIRHFYTYFSNQ